MAESKDLLELVITELKVPEIERNNKAVYDNSFQLSCAELSNYLKGGVGNDPTTVYIQALLLTRLDEERQTGPELLVMLNAVGSLLQALPASSLAIIAYMDRVLTHAIIYFEDGDFTSIAN